MLEACGPGSIPGDPDVLREAAAMLEGNSHLNEEILDDIRSARSTVLAGWSAPSAQGFDAFTSQAIACAAALIDIGPAAAGPLRTYADALEAAQNAFARATQAASSAEGKLGSAERGSDAERDAEGDLDQARGDKAAAGEAALAANEAAAQAIEALIGAVPAVPAGPAPPAPPLAGEDKPWYEDVADALGDAAEWTGDQLGAFGQGLGGGLLGVGGGILGALTGAVGDREDRRIANDSRLRIPPGGRPGRSRGEGGDFENDWAGRELLERYLTGGDDLTVENDPDWSDYMMANPILREKLNLLVQRKALAAYDQHRSDDVVFQTFSDRTAMEIDNGESISGYQYLHGTNEKAGGFEFRGSAEITRVNGGYEVHIPATYTWNDIIDPNSQYRSDQIKSTAAEILTLGRADGYALHLSWSSDATVRLDEDGNVLSVKGYPGE